ncbi:MAG: 50S ribosomal protein L3 [Candidatus Omnitrophica bacterium]|nr:50S ribosomal protein L3 [Candidatus Omnitrophota bacterium]
MTLKAILGKKIGMTQLFDEDGNVCSVTAIEAGPCQIVQVKSFDKEGYNAVQIGFEDKKEKKTKKPLLGHFKKAGIVPKRFLKEVRVSPEDKIDVGSTLSVDIFEEGEYVDVTGKSIGKGFQGCIKRHGWAKGPETHGSMSHREPGSMGASAYPSRVVKGHPLPGHMGYDRVTVQSLEIIKIDKENNLILVKGHVPGKKNNLLMLKQAKKKPFKKEKVKKEEQPVQKKGKAPSKPKKK